MNNIMMYAVTVVFLNKEMDLNIGMELDRGRVYM